MEMPCSGSIPIHYGNDNIEYYNCKQFYSKQQEIKTAQNSYIYGKIIHGAIIFLLMFIFMGLIKKFGLKRTLSKIWFIVSFHWMLKLMLKYKDGWTINNEVAL